MASTRSTRLLANKHFYSAEIRTDDKYHYINGHYHVKDELKAMRGARWQPDEKIWRVDNCRRNNVAIQYLEGLNPFKRYMLPLDSVTVNTHRINRFAKDCNFYKHQIELIRHGLVRRECIIAAEMGLGKSLCFFEIHDQSGAPETWYVGPKSAIASVQLDAWNWRFRGNITYMTYDELKKRMMEWKPGICPPQMVCFDESSKVKTPGSQRSQAAEHLANGIRDIWGERTYVILMSGSPAPKTPEDWYQQCEIACPGFIKEGDIFKFKKRLAIFRQESGLGGQTYPKLVAWRDGNTKLCNECGLPEENFYHITMGEGSHSFKPMTNEVLNLYKRLAGLVNVKFKKDCLDLPAKIYRQIRLTPSRDLLRAAKLCQVSSKTAAIALCNLRQLSDGFRYKTVANYDDTCLSCEGSGSTYDQKKELVVCQTCEGSGSRMRQERQIEEIASPKLDAVTDLLDECEESGRIVFYAGFTASIDRLCQHVKKAGWEYICVDGRGWRNSFDPLTKTPVEMLKEFQNLESKIEKLAFIGHAGSAGMGLTLTRSSMLCYVSNTFNAEERIQSEDRCHRLGMDPNRGCTVVDILLLPTDEFVLKNLTRKRDLQAMTLGEVESALDEGMR